MSNTTVYTMFAEAADACIRINEYNQQNLGAALKPTMFSPSWMREFATVTINAGRRVGKTTYIKERATSEDLIIVGRHADANAFRGTEATILLIGQVGNIIRNRGSLRRGYPADTVSYNRVYFDEVWGRLTDEQQDELHYLFSGVIPTIRANTIVIMGRS